VLVDACIRARLLGIPLLKIEGSVVLAPAGLTAAASVPRHPPIRGSARSCGAASTHPAAPGQGLVEAVRTINEGAELLAAAGDEKSPGLARRSRV
jgi:hypothetical protein